VSLDIQAIAEAIKAQLVLRISRAVHVYANEPANVDFPAIVINLAGDINYHASYGGKPMTEFDFDIEVRVSASNIDAGMAINDYLSVGVGKDSSIHDAIFADRSLGGLVEDCYVLTATAPTWVVDQERAISWRSATAHAHVLTRPT
jgi:hypothetical protein